jgi:3-oxoacyl-[acyl-carrier-protein] synthase-1
MTPLALTRLCIASSLGVGLDETRRALREGRSALEPCAFETVDIPTYIGRVAGVDAFALEGEWSAFDCRNNRLAALALERDNFIEAVAAARLRYGTGRIGVFLGTSTAGILETEIAYRDRDPATGALRHPLSYEKTQNTFSPAAFVRRYLNLEGPALVVSAACASTTKAFGNAARMIEAGAIDAALVGGADSLCLTTLYGFQSLGLTSTKPCRPFDRDRDGISIGEGAAFALLEKASADNADCIRLLGVGESSDAYHMSSPHPEGLGARLAMERALASAGRSAKDVDYVKLHGTATPVGDAAEDHAIHQLFEDGVVCSSLKGHVGHTLGASGIIEAVLCVLAMQDGFAPGTLQTQTLDSAMRARHLTERRPLPLRTVMANSFGFGGSNCSLLLGAA